MSWLAAAALFACKAAPDERISDELRICTREMQFDDPTARRLAPVSLGECLNLFPAVRDEYMLDDAGYAAYIRCRDAARTMDESMACTRKADMWREKLDVEVAADRAEAEAEALEAAAAAANAELLRAAEDAALARLDRLVAGGAIAASLVAELRERRSTATQGRFLAIVEDAASLIESGRIAPGHALAIQLPPPVDTRTRRPGSTGAELVFVDAKTSRVVARIASITREELATRNDDIEALLRWVVEDPERRDLEFVVVSSVFTGATNLPPPDAFAKALGAMKQSGLDRRRMISVDGTMVTPGEWIEDPDPFTKDFGTPMEGELDTPEGFHLIGKPAPPGE